MRSSGRLRPGVIGAVALAAAAGVVGGRFWGTSDARAELAPTQVHGRLVSLEIDRSVGCVRPAGAEDLCGPLALVGVGPIAVDDEVVVTEHVGSVGDEDARILVVRRSAQ